MINILPELRVLINKANFDVSELMTNLHLFTSI